MWTSGNGRASCTAYEHLCATDMGKNGYVDDIIFNRDYRFDQSDGGGNCLYGQQIDQGCSAGRPVTGRVIRRTKEKNRDYVFKRLVTRHRGGFFVLGFAAMPHKRLMGNGKSCVEWGQAYDK